MLKNLLRTIFLASTYLTVNMAFANNLGPNEAIKECTNYRGVAFEEDGHFYTTYAIAKFAGLSNKESMPLSFFSEYPDESQYTATKNSLISMIRLQKVLNKNGFEKQVVEKLHSLHGGDSKAIEKRRNSLKSAISANLKKFK